MARQSALAGLTGPNTSTNTVREVEMGLGYATLRTQGEGSEKSSMNAAQQAKDALNDADGLSVAELEQIARPILEALDTQTEDTEPAGDAPQFGSYAEYLASQGDHGHDHDHDHAHFGHEHHIYNGHDHSEDDHVHDEFCGCDQASRDADQEEADSFDFFADARADKGPRGNSDKDADSTTSGRALGRDPDKVNRNRDREEDRTEDDTTPTDDGSTDDTSGGDDTSNDGGDTGSSDDTGTDGDNTGSGDDTGTGGGDTGSGDDTGSGGDSGSDGGDSSSGGDAGSGEIGNTYLSGQDTPDGYNIEIIFHGDGWSQEMKQALATAAEDISDFVTGDVPDVNGIDDFRLNAYLEDLDGGLGVVGRGGFTALRSGEDRIVSEGRIRIDNNDTDFLLNNNIFEDVAFHEILHAMGFGTVWGITGLTEQIDGETRFVGENAIEAYNNIFADQAAGDANSDLGVPLSSDGAHWSQTYFGSEALSPTLSLSGNQISMMTIAALEDMGYETIYGDEGYQDTFFV